MAAPRQVVISLELEQGFKRHAAVFAGCHRYADQAGWQCTVSPAVDRALGRSSEQPPFDGVLARATKPLADAAKRAGVPLVNVWMNSPVQGLPSVFPDCHQAGVMSAGHLLARGFRRFGYLGFQQDIDSQRQLDGFREVTMRWGDRPTVHRFSRTGIAGRARGWERFVAGLQEWIDAWETPIGS